MKHISVYLPKHTHLQIRAIASRKNTSVSTLICSLLSSYRGLVGESPRWNPPAERRCATLVSVSAYVEDSLFVWLSEIAERNKLKKSEVVEAAIGMFLELQEF